MATGYDLNKARLDHLSQLGGPLARRAKSKCELTGASGVSLEIYEVEPITTELHTDNCLLLDARVVQQITKPQTIIEKQWRGTLEELIWSNLPAQQVMAYRILEYIAESEPWALDALESAIIDQEVADWAQSVKL